MLERAVIGATAGRMLREVLEALEAIALDRPLILLLDDLQWVDHATVDVLSEFARRRESARILLIATFRPLDVLLNESPIKLLKRALGSSIVSRNISGAAKRV
jgi:predicted ATPase